MIAGGNLADLSMPTSQLLRSQRALLDGIDPSIDGYNVGANCGGPAGQSILHCHIHLIPRRTGDVETPRGGIRHVIPGKGNYGSGK